MRRFPPHTLRDYAVLADGERGVVVGPRGEFAWMCAPRWNDDAVFASLIGGGGVYAVSPVGERYVWGGHYEEGTLIWRSRWITTAGVVECREALARPADPSTAVLLREVVGVDGTNRVRVVLDPQAGFGAHPLSELDCHDGVWEGRVGPLWMRCTGLAAARPDRGGLVFDLTLAEGARRHLVVEISTDRPSGPPPDPEQLWSRTEQSWHEDVPDATGLWARRDVRHAFAVLHGMSASSGALVAATTTSLPERAEAGRNYDYRYAWIRDQAMVGQAAAAVGPSRLLDNAVGFVGARLREDGSRLRPAYTVTGDPVPSERTLSLPGYPGGSARVGNGAGEQFQLDAFGEALLLFAAAARHGALSREDWKAVEIAVRAVADCWQRPDAGIWELDDQRWAHSRLITASGVHAVALLAPASQRRDWQQLGDDLVRSVDDDCLHPSGRWQRAPDDPRPDAALLIPIFRSTSLAADDPRVRRTVEAILDDLTDEEFCYRFRHGDTPLASAEGAFVLCGFHMSMALEKLGERTLATRWFERNRAACGTSGLFTEEYDVGQRQQRGNLPQAFVHGALIEASARLSR
ncbi:glycoside hydrolase family 15 protein [Nocardioides terrisoli]|uniref:glycoside hydrolase family 15 protein n=1 Tax=Nocardioides terrisoli TaxID=3388267 RepID=UPI00287BAADD|nr:glycoside hydrolase family 15 protein [Nocardioides marmorisolisilvae]